MSYPNPLRELGRTGTKVPAIGFGGMGLSNIYGTADDNESRKLLQEAARLGCVFWDTANVYGWGHNEKLISPILKEHRDKIFICTKFGLDFDEGVAAVKGIAGSREYVLKACDASLKRMGVDYIDLYYQHRVDPTVPIEETVGAMKELQDAGKIKHIGLSECSKETLARALKVARIEAVQIEYSPFEIGPETSGLLALMREHGVSLIAYSPFGRGLLTGQIKSLDDLPADDYRRHDPRYSPENFPLNLRLVERISALAKAKGATPAAFCLAWVLYQGEDFIVIPGTRSIDRLKQNLEAGRVLQSFTEKDDAAVRDLTSQLGVVGERYGEAMMSWVNL